jgi:hypothetical protein
MEKLTKELLQFCEKKKLEVVDEPTNELERGFKLATIFLTSELKRIVTNHTGEVLENDLLHLLDEKLKEHKE